MLFLRKFFAGIFFFLASSLFLPFFFTFVLLQTYLSEPFLAQTLAPASYEKIPIIFDLISQEKGRENVLPAELVKKRFHELLPKESYTAIVQSFTSAFFEGFQKYAPGEPFKVLFIDAKKTVFSELEKMAEKIPVCAPNENFEHDLCMPRGFSSSQVKMFRDEFTRGVKRDFDAAIPNSLTLRESESLPWLQSFSMIVKVRAKVVLGLVAALGVMIGMMVLILFRPISLWMRWLSSIFFLFGLEAFGLYYLFLKGPDFLAKSASINPSQIELISWLLSYGTLWMLWGGILFVSLAAAAFIGSFFLRPKPSHA